MKRFEYEITAHPAVEFRQVAFFCSEEGACNLEEVPADQMKVLAELMNQRGLAGWELVQIAFSQGGLLAFWKRELSG